MQVVHVTDASNEALGSANTRKDVEVSRTQLPLSCPMPDQKLWNSHPRVYLPVEATGSAQCPYCGTRYRLVD